MRIALGIFLGIVIVAIPTISTQAIVYPFGGKIVAVYTDPEACNDLIMIVVGARPGIFEFEATTIWYTLPYPPLVGAWTIGVADSPAPCSNIILGGSSALPSL